MKKLTVIILSLCLSAAVAACGGGGSKEQVKDDTDTVKRQETVDAESGMLPEEDADEADDVFLEGLEQEWPGDIVHADMPEYDKGKLNGWNYWSSDDEDDIFILISDTNQNDVDEYINMLVSAGFQVVNGDIYRKELYEVELDWSSDNSLQISSYKTETAAWPEELEWITEIKKGDLTGVIEPTDDMPNYVQLYYINFNQSDLDAWTKELEANGFTLEDGTIYYNKEVELRGEKYSSLSIQVQENGSNEWMIDFCYNLE